MAAQGFQFLETPGPYCVGLQVVEQFDYSRVYRSALDALGRHYNGPRARPIQTLIWFPAASATAKEMSVADYLELWKTETRFEKPTVMPEMREALAGMRQSLTTSLWARRNAAAAPGRFPVVVYAPSYSATAWENADLCEYLASQGYVVLASPSMGATTRGMTRDLQGIGAQVADIAFLIAHAHTLSNADTSTFAVVGFSWGAMSGLFAAARDDRIKALVSLDGSIRYYPGWVEQAGDVNPEDLTIPLLSFAQRHFSPEDQERYSTAAERSGRNVLNAWKHGDVVNVQMLRLTHAEHSSMLQRDEHVWWKLSNVYPMMKGGYDRLDGATGYAWLARYTGKFLDAYLKENMAAKAFLRNTPEENGVPRHNMVVELRAAAGPPVSLKAFRTELRRRGFEHAADVYAAMKGLRQDFDLAEAAMECWAEELLADEHIQEAIELLQLSVQLHPQSSAARGKLGRAYQSAGRSELAGDSYRRALELDPTNADAIMRLMLLKHGAS